MFSRTKVSKRNLKGFFKVNFSTKIDFSADGGLRIGEIKHMESIEASYSREKDLYTFVLNKIFDTACLTKNHKELFSFHFLSYG
jgi:hypothetical protein